MKKLASLTLLAAALTGCASVNDINWQANNQASIQGSDIAIKSNLWVDMMPKIGEPEETNLHGAIYLESSSTLPADLNVTDITIRQGEQIWLIDAESAELRAHSDTQWEVAFKWVMDVNSEETVDIAVELTDLEQNYLLVESDVEIDTVY
ncbi:hypothetical protein [Vibrio mexicanus]|uniref:hypothetical protein n=1 Tax=Vibrio mexicanus TaxID=1004326 RepID=UPI00063CD98C|nr:hypothetical protein [Vibrio mexicanus]